jgi:predicted transglutaminase-like cysteine proteinase
MPESMYMRSFKRVLGSVAAISLALHCGGAQAEALKSDQPASLQHEHMQLGAPALAPLAYSRFCLQYRDECEVHRMRGGVGLMRQRWAELVRVNADVNRAIAPQPEYGGVLAERWAVAPRAGDCHDYAVTKRHELMARGWPSRALLLAEVVIGTGEHHLVLVIRTRDGDFVADNLVANIRPWFMTRYQWMRMQTPQNPIFWSTVAAALSGVYGTKLASLSATAPRSDVLIEADETEIAMASAPAVVNDAPVRSVVAQAELSAPRAALNVQDPFAAPAFGLPSAQAVGPSHVAAPRLSWMNPDTASRPR